MEDGLLSLKWNNHQTTLVHLLKVLREQCFYTDAVLVCGSRFFGVHRLVLMACSDYFCEIFSQVKDCPKPVIVLQDIASSELEALLDYMYLGEVDVHQTKLPNLIKAAECLHIKGLAACEDEPTKPLKTLVNKSKKDVLSNNSRSFDSANSFSSSKHKGSLLNSGNCDTKNNRHSFESEPPKKRQRNLDNQSNLENSNRYSSEVRSLSSSSSEIVQVQNDCTSSKEKMTSHIDNSNSSQLKYNHSENISGGQDCSNAAVDGSVIKSEDVVSNDGVLELKVEDEEPQQQQQDSDLLHSSLGSAGQHFQHYLHTGIDEHLFSDVDQGGDVGGLHGIPGEAADLSAGSAGLQPMKTPVEAAAADGGGANATQVSVQGPLNATCPGGFPTSQLLRNRSQASQLAQAVEKSMQNCLQHNDFSLLDPQDCSESCPEAFVNKLPQQQQQDHENRPFLTSGAQVLKESEKESAQSDKHYKADQCGNLGQEHKDDRLYTYDNIGNDCEVMAHPPSVDDTFGECSGGGGGSGNRVVSNTEVLIIYSVQDLPKPHSVRNTSFSCGHCEKIFYHRGNFICHLGTHTGEKPYCCSFCPFKTSRRGNLESHIRSRHLNIGLSDFSSGVGSAVNLVNPSS